MWASAVSAAVREPDGQTARFFEQTTDDTTVNCIVIDDKNRGHERLPSYR